MEHFGLSESNFMENSIGLKMVNYNKTYFKSDILSMVNFKNSIRYIAIFYLRHSATVFLMNKLNTERIGVA